MKPTESYEQGEPCMDEEKIVQALYGGRGASAERQNAI